MKDKGRLSVWPCAALSLVLCIGLCHATAASPRTASVVQVEALLKPSTILESIECQAPAGVDFKPADRFGYSLSGNLSGGRGVVTLRPEAGLWDISDYSYLRVDFVNRGRGLVWIRGRLDNKGAEDWRNSAPSMAYVMPGERATLGFPFQRSSDDDDAPAIFDKQNSKPNGYRGHWKSFDPRAVIGCRLVIQSTDSELNLDNLQISLAQPYGVEANAALMELPYLDRFGQVRQLDWEGKVDSERALLQRSSDERRRLSATPDPAAFNQYGGWADGPQLEATGYFRVEKYQDRWWLVDPSGRLFFSKGANSVGFSQKTPLAGREALFEWVPSRERRFREAAFVDGSLRFIAANLIREFGASWKRQAYGRVHDRMRSWGLNTIGAWSDAEVMSARRTPYTTIVHLGHGYSPLGKNISDPFSDQFRQALRNGLKKQREAGHQNEWCIGVFIDNEIDWSEDFVGNALASPPKQPARLAIIAALKEQYSDLNAFNAAWSVKLGDWDELNAIPDERNTAIQQDVTMLRGLIAGEYYQQCQAAMRDILPNLLYLGSRIHKATPEVMDTAIRYVDVLSLNVYAPLARMGVRGDIDKPCLITEFHFGAPDRGVPGVGLSPVGNQRQRSRAYLAYVLDAMLAPNIVGTHWFAYTDQSAAGRPGENYQIGFVDVTDGPYTEFTEISRLLAENMYALSGEETADDLLELMQELLSGR